MVMVDTVYIVVNSGIRILSVWSSRSLAELMIKHYQSQDKEQYDRLRIIERIINVALNK